MKKYYAIVSLIFSLLISNNVLSCSTPSQAASVSVSSKTANGATVSWTKYGSYSIVVIGPYQSGNISGPSITSTVNQPPYYDGASSNYASAPIYSGSFRVVYEGTGSSVAVTGLSASTRYSVYVFSYTYDSFSFPSLFYTYCVNTGVTSSNREDFYTYSTEPTGKYTVSNVTSYSTTTLSFNISTASGTVGARRVVVIQPVGGTYNPPVDGVQYGTSGSTSSASYAYGSGPFLGGNSYIVYNGTATSFTVTGLSANKNYFFIVYEYNVNSSLVNTTENYYTSDYLFLSHYTDNTAPTLTSISNQSNCLNSSGSVNLSGIGTGGESSQTISISATSSNTSVVATPTVTYTSPNATGTLNYSIKGVGTATITVTVNDGGYYNPTTSKNFTVTVIDKPTAVTSISGNSAVCAGSNLGLTANGSTGATSYSWVSYYSGVNFNSTSTASGTNSVTFDPATYNNYSSIPVYLYVYPKNSCGTGSYGTFSVTVNGKPTPANAGSDINTCSSVASLHANGPKIGTGIWSTAAGSASCSFNNVSDSLTNVSGMVAGPPAILVWTITNGVCTPSRDTVEVTPIVCAIQADFTVNNTQPCVNTAATFTDGSVASGGINTYSWEFDYNGTGSASPATSTTAGPHNVTYSTTGTKTVRLTITGPGGSSVETKTAFINVRTAPGALSAVSGDNSVCQGEEQVLYSVNVGNGVTSYSWTLPTGATINTGSGTDQISVDFGTNAQSGNISVKGVNACGQGSASTYSITVNPLPDAAGSIIGNDVICENANNENYSVANINNATSYVWTSNNGNISFDAPANTNTVNADVIGSFKDGDMISVKGNNSCGDGPASDLVISFNPKPDPATDIIGDIDITACEGVSANVTFMVDPINNASTYSWFVPNGVSITSGSGTNTIDIQFDQSVANNSGVIAVAGNNGCGYGFPDTIHYNFHPTPEVDICYSSVDDKSEYIQLAWEKPSLSAAIDSFKIYRKFGNNYLHIGSVDYNSPSLFIDSLSTPNNTYHFYTITAVDSCGNESFKDTTKAHRTIFLITALGTSNAISLVWNGYSGLTADWYRIMRDTSGVGDFVQIDSVANGVHLYSDPNGQLYPNVQYRIDAVLAGNCTPSLKYGPKHSDKLFAGFNTSKSNIKNNPTSVSINNASIKREKIAIIPNPNNGNFVIGIPTIQESTHLIIYDQLGQIVFEEQLPAGSNNKSINLSGIANGIYSIQIRGNSINSFEKFIIQ